MQKYRQLPVIKLRETSSRTSAGKDHASRFLCTAWPIGEHSLMTVSAETVVEVRKLDRSTTLPSEEASISDLLDCIESIAPLAQGSGAFNAAFVSKYFHKTARCILREFTSTFAVASER